MTNNFNLSEHIEKAINIYENVKTAQTKSTGCYIMTSQSEFIHISFIKTFIEELKNELMIKQEEHTEMIDEYNKEMFEKIDKLAGKDLI